MMATKFESKKQKELDFSDTDSSSTASYSRGGGGIGVCLYLWWAIVLATAYVYDFTPVWAFGGLCGVSLVVTMFKLVWRRAWFLTLRARCCIALCWCCRAAPKNEIEESTLKQHSPWRRQLKLFFEMALPYFRDSTRGRWLFAGMILLTMLDSAVNVVFSYTSKAFYDALEKKDSDVFFHVLWIYTAILIGGAPVTAFYQFQRQRLSVAWREWMTERTLDLYLNHRVYYLLPNEIDNPDQRIAQDVNAFTTYSLSLLVTIVDNTINLISMSVILYTIEPNLFLVIIGYTFVGTTMSVWLGARLVPLNFERLQYEADLRYSLVRLREHAESIAFYRGEPTEHEHLTQRLACIVDNQKSIIGTERTLQVFTALHQYVTWVLPIAVVAPHYFAGTMELGTVTQARSAFVQITADLSIIIKQFNELSAFSAGIDRLSSFYDAVREADDSRSDQTPLLQAHSHEDDTKASSGRNAIQLNESSHFSCTNLTLMTPDASRTLIYNLTMAPPLAQQRVLITGPSGVGKSSLLRAIGGLWTTGEGVVNQPSNAMFLPQKPYCTLKSLRHQLVYPRSDAATVPDSELESILHRVGLSHLQDSLDVEDDWSHRLSLGEQQRLAFGRILLHPSPCVLLDEATSALDLESEERMYRLLEQAASSYISVGHRPTLYQYHSQRLHLLPNGAYEISVIGDQHQS